MSKISHTEPSQQCNITHCTTIEFWYSIPTVFKIGQLQSEYSPGIITVGIQSETFFVVGIQSQYSRIVSGYEALDMKSHSFCVRMKFW